MGIRVVNSSVGEKKSRQRGGIQEGGEEIGKDSNEREFWRYWRKQCRGGLFSVQRELFVLFEPVALYSGFGFRGPRTQFLELRSRLNFPSWQGGKPIWSIGIPEDFIVISTRPDARDKQSLDNY